MKRLFVFFVLLASMTALYAQPRAIGGRLGYGLEFSYEHTLHDANMLSIDAGLCGFHGAEVAITYDWINPGGHSFASVWSGRGEWNWYAGVGGAAGGHWKHSTGAFVGVAGRLGVEYNFWFPLQLSFDYRPVLGLGISDDAFFYRDGFFSGAIAFGVRYRF
ncbi:MAG: hypothetical protein MJ002_07410 [Paludibacteraceae bacterium]|nr:hypothetical protein [Paludibacteraceae bacterium]